MAQPSSGLAEQLQNECLEGTLWEPYTAVCADVRDVRDQFLPQLAKSAGDPLPLKTALKRENDGDNLPVPGGLAVGTIYLQLPALNSGRLHTKMFVYPDGLQPDGDLPLLYTTATSRVHHGLEVVGIYWREHVKLGRLGLWAWPCLPDYPCPDGDISPGWQWITGLPNLACNITHGIDQGGHAQKFLYYANHTDKLDQGQPPLWKSALYLWNYCDAAWDLTWQHTYREDKVDCSEAGSGCGWWGPGIETFGANPYPRIAELGYEESLLYHDGVWSELRPPETDFRDPAIWAPTTPWQLFHLDENRSYGVGNWIDTNDAPAIDAQAPLAMLEDEDLAITLDSLVINDPDVDPNYHVAYELTLYGGDNYTHGDALVTPAPNYSGILSVPITVNDGAADSQTFALQIDVIPVNDAPVITGQNALQTLDGTPITITLQDLQIDDPDNDMEDLTLFVQDGAGYRRVDNTITPQAGTAGELRVAIVVSDSELESAAFELVVLVKAAVTPSSQRRGGGGVDPLLLALLLLIPHFGTPRYGARGAPKQ